MWGFNNKSKYKKRDEYKWWEDERYLEEEEEKVPSYGGYGRKGGYSYDWYKPRYDMSISLETRVRQLIRTITGKNLKLIRASGWGNDNEYFYYNAEDLQNATDDEVLGRILHQLAKELYVDKKELKTLNDADPDYRHLLATLEDNRADYLLQGRYAGVGYYAAEVWDSRKFTDNPINSYQLPLVSMVDIKYLLKTSNGHTLDVMRYEHDASYKKEIDNIVARENQDRAAAHNPAWEFCFNIAALQNGEVDWDFEKDDIKANFEKAAPYIREYLAALTFEDALKIYPDIKKYYPKPTKQQQDQMEQKMASSEGLTQAQMERLAEEAKGSAASKGKGTVRGESDKGDDTEANAFIKEFADDYRRGKFDIESNMAIYREYLGQYKGVANVLYTLIRSILKDNTTKRYDRPFKRGKLDAKRIYKLVSTDNLRIFKKKRVINEKDYLMMVVVDMSGSMRNGNSKYAAQGAIVLTDVLERLGFPYEVVAYNGNVYGVKMFSKPLKPEILPALEWANGDNNERETIEVITKHIVNYDPSNIYKKSIFWITDGQSNDPSTVKQKVTELEKKHNATVFAVGIGDVEERFLKETYNTYLKVDRIEQLPVELTNLMRGQFRRE